jgi:hypothetical protein
MVRLLNDRRPSKTSWITGRVKGPPAPRRSSRRIVYNARTVMTTSTGEASAPAAPSASTPPTTEIRRQLHAGPRGRRPEPRFHAFSIFWGGWYGKRNDGMHFECVTLKRTSSFRAAYAQAWLRIEDGTGAREYHRRRRPRSAAPRAAGSAGTLICSQVLFWKRSSTCGDDRASRAVSLDSLLGRCSPGNRRRPGRATPKSARAGGSF